MIQATGYVLLAGWTGIFSLGHAGFVAIGAYVSTFLIIKSGFPWFIAVFIGGIAAGACSWVIGKASLKLKMGYFAIASLGLGETIRLIIENVEAIGGPRGITGIPGSFSEWYILLVFMICGVIIIVNIKNSKFGRSFLAIRDDALAAENMGINTAKNKEAALVISAIYCGISGAFYASFMSYIQPAMFSADMSSYMSTWVVFGGLGSLTGGLFSTFLLTAITESFRSLALYRMFFYGIALVFIIVVRPNGLFGTFELTPASVKVIKKKVTDNLAKIKGR